MNVYPCTYNGNIGYGCRLGREKWMFVPELAQVDSRVHRNIALTDLSFHNRREQHFEFQRESRGRESALRNWFRTLLLPDIGPQTMGGRLFMVH